MLSCIFKIFLKSCFKTSKHTKFYLPPASCCPPPPTASAASKPEADPAPASAALLLLTYQTKEPTASSQARWAKRSRNLKLHEMFLKGKCVRVCVFLKNKFPLTSIVVGSCLEPCFNFLTNPLSI